MTPPSATAAVSSAADFQVGGTSKFSVDKFGIVTAAASFRQTPTGAGISVSANGASLGLYSNNSEIGYCNGTTFILNSAVTFGWSATSASSGSYDTVLVRDAANTLALRNGAAAQTFNVYGTYTASPLAYERLSISATGGVSGNAIIGTNKTGTGVLARGLEFQTDGVTRMTLASNGLTIGSLNIQPTNSAIYNAVIIGFGSNTAYVGSPSDGVLRITNNALNGFNRLQFGGETASFPALKRSTTTLQARLADDSAFAPIQGKLTTDTAYTGTVVAATGYITIYDSTGTAYRVPCAV